MSRRVRQESPLAARKLQAIAAGATLLNSSSVAFYERAFLGHINVRGDPDSSRFASAAKGVLGCALPLEADSYTEGEDIRACWLGPDEWLILCDGKHAHAIAEELRDALRGELGAVTEVSSGQTVLGVSGAHARDVIAKGCPLNLHPRVFGVGRCAQSYLARAGITVLQITDAPVFELIVRRSFADYVWMWLEDAAREYGYAVIEAPPFHSSNARAPCVASGNQPALPLSAS